MATKVAFDTTFLIDLQRERSALAGAPCFETGAQSLRDRRPGASFPGGCTRLELYLSPTALGEFAEGFSDGRPAAANRSRTTSAVADRRPNRPRLRADCARVAAGRSADRGQRPLDRGDQRALRVAPGYREYGPVWPGDQSGDHNLPLTGPLPGSDTHGAARMSEDRVRYCSLRASGRAPRQEGHALDLRCASNRSNGGRSSQ